MATIHYSLSGEGRGHAARAQVLINLLKTQHRLVVHTYGAAYAMLEPIYRTSEVELREIPGMRFVYDKSGTLNRPASLTGALPFLFQMPGRAHALARQLEREQVDLMIADFEPLLPRAAELAGIPVMSVDHQQFLTCYDLSALPPELKRKADSLAPFVHLYYKKLSRAVISAFFFPPLKKQKSRHPITQAGVLLRDEILHARPETGAHLVAYVRRQAPRKILDSLQTCGLPVHVYGHEHQGRSGNLDFREINPSRFAEDLASAQALITTAGNQVVGEALYLRKPVLAYPEPGNFEQHVNGHFLEASGQGWSRAAHNFEPHLVQNFIQGLEKFRDHIRPERLNGNRIALDAVKMEMRARSQEQLLPGTNTSLHRSSSIRLTQFEAPKP